MSREYTLELGFLFSTPISLCVSLPVSLSISVSLSPSLSVFPCVDIHCVCVCVVMSVATRG